MAEPISVRYQTGTSRGFLVLRDMDGKLLANGEQVQTLDRNRITKRLTFHFTDGSLDDEQTTFSQDGTLHLLTYHHIQKGPSFPHPIDMSIDGATGRVTVHYSDDDGNAQTDDTTLDLPADISNGMMVDVLQNVRASVLPLTVSYIAATPKPRLIQLKITSAGRDSFSTAGLPRSAIHYTIAIHLGGLEGVLGSWTGKTPPDSQVWISDGVPTFVESESILSAGGPMWRIETAPVVPPHRSAR